MDFIPISLVMVAILGAIVGSFLNVVIYRLPRGLSVTDPRWSFCPHCRSRIRFYHNVPILGWLWLRGRCHSCAAPIPTIYPLIECLTLLLFITVWDAMFTTQVVPGVKSPATDWPLAIAYLVLFGGLLAGAGMDIESYIIDIRICFWAMAAGIISQGLWWGLSAQAGAFAAFNTPMVLPPGLCLVGVAMGGAWLITSLIVRWLGPRGNGDEMAEVPGVPDGRGPQDLPEPPESMQDTLPPGPRFRPLPIIVLGSLTMALLAWQLVAGGWRLVERIPPGGQRGFAACFVFMLVLVLASMVPRRSDTQIAEEIEAEKAGARSMAIHELAWFVPSIVVGIALMILLRHGGHIDDDWGEILRTVFGNCHWALYLGGGLEALAAGVLAAGIGWTVRIAGTLAFGKEAFGSGDIYIMAAIGAVAGLPLLVFAFFLAALLALVGVLATIFHKSSRAIPFGPWLAIGALVALWVQPVLLGFFRPAAALLWAMLTGRSDAWSIGR